jgi:UPF0271 protein
VDLNSDLGEGYGIWRMADDSALLEIITSANVACGFHAGDPTTMRESVQVAVDNGVTVGAHVSFPDRRGFGRRNMDLPAHEVIDDVTYQIGALDAIARAHGTRVAFVKPHGALYNRIAVDDTLPGSVAEAAGRRAGLQIITEAFADRAYDNDGRLVPRDRSGAVISDPDVVAERALRVATDGVITTVSGERIELTVQTLCVHGDSPGSVALAAAIRTRLTQAGITLSSCVS